MKEPSSAVFGKFELPQSSLVVRVRPLNSNDKASQAQKENFTKSYRVVIQVDVADSDILGNCGADGFTELKESTRDYLRAYVEREVGWLTQSFSQVKVQSITRPYQRRRGSKKSKPITRKSIV